ncbi:MAG: hypothetical protein NTY07_16645 [Bacteroidia bacterium]|nr:hypothetical protein [Bacteroidia bacterium]
MKKVIQGLLIVGSIVLAYFIYSAILNPIDFKTAQDLRYSATIESLKNIRKAQIAFKDVNGRFTGSWDTLAVFVKKGTLPLVKKIGSLSDEQLEAGMTEKEAINKGLIIRDTVRVAVFDSLFGKSFDIDKMRYIPFTKNEVFFLGTNVITTGSGVKVAVFEARAHNNQILNELHRKFKQEIINLNEKRRLDGKYPGLKVGSLTETNNSAGNWE